MKKKLLSRVSWENSPWRGEKCRKKTAKGDVPSERDKEGKGVIATRWKVKACHQIKLLQNFADVQAFKFSFKDTAAVGELTSIDYSAAVLSKIRWFTCKWIFQWWNNCDSNLSEVAFTMIYHKLWWHSLCAASDTNSTGKRERDKRVREGNSWDGNEFINLRENPHPFWVIIRSHEIIKRISNTLPGHR